MEVIAVKCAICGHGMKFAADKAGRKAKCPKCETVLTVPKPEVNGDAAKDDEGDGEYGVVIDKDLEGRWQRIEEEDRLRLKELKKKKSAEDPQEVQEPARCRAVGEGPLRHALHLPGHLHLGVHPPFARHVGLAPGSV